MSSDSEEDSPFYHPRRGMPAPPAPVVVPQPPPAAQLAPGPVPVHVHVHVGPQGERRQPQEAVPWKYTGRGQAAVARTGALWLAVLCLLAVGGYYAYDWAHKAGWI